jgi:hypothetical protein
LTCICVGTWVGDCVGEDCGEWGEGKPMVWDEMGNWSWGACDVGESCASPFFCLVASACERRQRIPQALHNLQVGLVVALLFTVLLNIRFGTHGASPPFRGVFRLATVAI